MSSDNQRINEVISKHNVTFTADLIGEMNESPRNVYRTVFRSPDAQLTVMFRTNSLVDPEPDDVLGCVLDDYWLEYNDEIDELYDDKSQRRKIKLAVKRQSHRLRWFLQDAGIDIDELLFEEKE